MSSLGAGALIQWRDLCVVIDDGAIDLARYEAIEAAMRDQARRFSPGIGCLVILPPDASSPPEPSKLRMKSLWGRLGPQIMCIAYLVEGTGAREAASHAKLVATKVLSKQPYPVYVESTIQSALTKLRKHLRDNLSKKSDVNALLKVIAEGRARFTAQDAPAIQR
jgi:hypothetical protein